MALTSQTWEYVQMAILMSGGVVVGIAPHDLDENINEIANRAKLVGLVIQNSSLLKKISTQVRSNLKFIVGMEDTAQDNEIENFMRLTHLQKPKNQDSGGSSDKSRGKDPATIIFTSGTTGTPKGIMYTHEQVCLACASILEAFNDIKEDSNLVCWLPLSNLFQRMINFCAIVTGASTYFVENPRDVVKYITSVNPHIFIGVPRFFEKLYSGIMDGVNQKPLWMRKLIQWALKVGDAHASSLRLKKTPAFTTRISHIILDSLILKRLGQFMGSNLKYMISGSAPIPQWLLERFHAMGILIFEAYGISENIIPVAMNSPGAVKFGTVGKPLSGNEIKFLDDGELLVKGPGIFSGYYNDESKKSSLTSDGYLSTGDYAAIDNEGFITLTGRKSEIFKTSTGRRIAPVGIEDRIRMAPYVEHAVVFGAGRKFLVVLLSISCPLLFERARELNMALDENQATIPTVLYDTIKQDVIQEVAPLPKYQRPAGLLLTPHPFTVKGRELTGNLKLRRKNIEEKFKEHISELYAKLEETQHTDDIVIYSL
jgi:long-chain acyl-CoA synthetase